MQNLFFITYEISLFEWWYICTKIFIETLIGMINKERLLRLLRLLHIIMQSINEYRKIEAFFSFFSQDVCLNNNNKKMFMYLIFKLLSTARVCCEHMHGQHNCFQVFLIYRCSSVIDFERILIIIMDCLSLDRLFHVIYAVGKQKLKADYPIVMKAFIFYLFAIYSV